MADLDSIPFPRVQELLERIRRAEVEILLADNGTDVGIPTWNCYLMDMKEPVSLGSTAHGMGSALEQETAMIRAITEAVQGRCVFLSGVRDIVPSKDFRRSLRGDARSSLEIVQRYTKEEMNLASLKDNTRGTFEEDVHHCLESLQAVGLDRVLVFRLSKREDPVQAVKVVVPGAEGYIFPYYRPGDRGIRSIQKKLGQGSPLHRKESFSW